MTIKQAGNPRVFYDELKKRFPNTKITFVGIDEIHIHLLNVEIDILIYHDLLSNFSMYFDRYQEHLILFYYGRVENTARREVERKFYEFKDDTDGIAIMIGILETIENVCCETLHKACEEAEEIYVDKYRGNIAGSKFGF